MNDHERWQPPRLKAEEHRRRAFGVPLRNWVVVVVIVAVLGIWQLRGGGTSFDVAPDLRNYSRTEYDAAKFLMTAGFAIVTTPAACQQKFDAFDGNEDWKAAVNAWNDRHEPLMTKVIAISQETGLSGGRQRNALQDDALRLVDTLLARWQGRIKEECARYVDQLNDGLWDLANLPEFADHIITIEAAPAETDD